MPEFFRSRDVTMFSRDDSTTVVVSSAMASGGWPGGQGVQWVNSSEDALVVTYSHGPFAGFLVWGHDEVGDRYTGMTQNQPHYRFATMFFGSVILSTASFEQYTLASRLVGPLVPLVYDVNEPLYFSLRGLFTNEDELTATVDPEAPSPIVGYVAQVPKAVNNSHLGIQTAM